MRGAGRREKLRMRRAKRAAFLPTKRRAPGAARPAKRSRGGVESGRPEARRRACRAPSRSNAATAFQNLRPSRLFCCPDTAARTCAGWRRPRQRPQDCGRGRRPFRPASTRFRSARHMGLRPLRCPPPLRTCRRPAQGAAWRSCRARRTPPAACRPCPWRIADSGAARPTSPPSALPAPSRPRRAGLFAGRRAPHARPFPRPRTAGGLPGTP